MSERVRFDPARCEHARAVAQRYRKAVYPMNLPPLAFELQQCEDCRAWRGLVVLGTLQLETQWAVNT